MARSGGNLFGAYPLGFLVVLAGAILSLVYLWRILPQALAIPSEKRALHYIVSLLAIFIANAILGAIIGIGSVEREYAADDVSGDSGLAGGMFGGIMRRPNCRKRLIKTAMIRRETQRSADQGPASSGGKGRGAARA